IVGKNNRRFFSNDYLPQEYDNVRENWGIFRKMKEKDGAIAWDSNYSYDRMYPSDVALTAGRTLNDMDSGSIIGYILIDINENALSSMYKDHVINEDEHFYIVDEQGNIISSDDNQKEIGTKLQASYLNRILEGNNGYFYHTIDDIPSIVAYHTSNDIGL